MRKNLIDKIFSPKKLEKAGESFKNFWSVQSVTWNFFLHFYLRTLHHINKILFNLKLTINIFLEIQYDFMKMYFSSWNGVFRHANSCCLFLFLSKFISLSYEIRNSLLFSSNIPKFKWACIWWLKRKFLWIKNKVEWWWVWGVKHFEEIYNFFSFTNSWKFLEIYGNF